MQINGSDIFTQLPSGVFRPLTGVNQRLHWHSLVRLYNSFFDSADFTEHGHARVAIMDAITLVIEQYPTWWTDTDDEAVTTPRSRANNIYRLFSESGWFEETRIGYSDYVTMPARVSQLLATLIEISEGRALIMTGRLKSLRAGMREALEHPDKAADILSEAAKDAKRFAQHLNGIRGSIKSLYDKIRGDVPAREIVSTFFDNFLSEILVSDYSAIKTTENPLSIRDELLRILSTLRYDPDTRQALFKDYKNLCQGMNEATVEQRMNQDLSQLEKVFLNIDRQLDAIDNMKLRYEKRVDTVIEYASRSPRTLSKDISRIVHALTRHDDNSTDEISVRLPVVYGERIGEYRLAKAKKRRSPPKPRSVTKTIIDEEVLRRTKIERAANMAVHVSASTAKKYLDSQLESQQTLQSNQLVPLSLQDYFCILFIQRLGHSPKPDSRENSAILNHYHLTPTDDWATNEYFNFRPVIITKRKST